MKKLALVAVATTLVFCSAPVLAQQLGVSIGDRGGADVSVRGGDRDGFRGRDSFRERNHDRNRVVVRGHRGDGDVVTTGGVGCRTIIVRKENAMGDTVTKRIRKCN
jgi:hypothetical protein